MKSGARCAVFLSQPISDLEQPASLQFQIVAVD